MKKIFALILALSLIMIISLPAFAADNPASGNSTSQAAIENDINKDTVSDNKVLAPEAQADKIKKDEMKAFRGKLTDKMAELNQLRTVCKANWDAVKGLNATIKSNYTAFKESIKAMEDKEAAKQMLSGLKGRIEPIRAGLDTIRSKVGDLRKAKDAEWVKYRAAVKARDLTAATDALNGIISLKSQIVDLQPQIISAKQEIIKAFSN